MKWSVFAVIFMLSITACQYQEEQVISYPDFDRQLWPYLEEFEKAALDRNFNLDINNLDVSGDIQEIEQERVAGFCQYSHPDQGLIRIDQSFWNNASNWTKEFVVFHELGHCILRRLHREDQYTNGTCVSIMQSGTGSCFINYGADNKELYLDELFSPREF